MNQSVQTALAVLEAVAHLQPVGLSDLARRVDRPKATVQRALVSLRAADWLEHDLREPTRWILGSKAFVVGSRVGDRGGLRQAALPHMGRLATEVGETIHLMVPDGDSVLLVERIDSTHPVRAFSPLGSRSPLHAGSNGKAILAHRGAEEIERYVAAGLPASTERTITSAEQLVAELGDVRERGWAVSDEEYQVGVVSVASAILNRSGRPIGSLSISAPAHRVPVDVRSSYGALVRDVARTISSAVIAGDG